MVPLIFIYSSSFRERNIRKNFLAGVENVGARRRRETFCRELLFTLLIS